MKSPIEPRKVQDGLRRSTSRSEVPGERDEQLGVDGAEEALDLAPTLGPSDDRVDNADAQFDGGALEVVAGEVGPVVDVQDVGDAAHRPGWVGLRPDRLPQCEGCVECGGCAGEDGVPADGAGVVVHHGRQPRPVGLSVGADDKDVEFGVVGLPGLVRAFSATSEDELVPIPVRGRPL